MTTPLKIYFVVGEESGDALGASVLEAFEKIEIAVSPCGLAGKKMTAAGMQTAFDISQLSVMGVSGVIAKLPKLLGLINICAQDVLAKQPDVLFLIDSPEFSYRVAKKVRAKAPHIKIIKFVAPSVWAWRPGRAKKLKPFIDHILSILPFEQKVMEELGGPKTSYVGHPLGSKLPRLSLKAKEAPSNPIELLALPGSRSSETKRLLPIIGDTLSLLKERGVDFNATIPAVSHLRNDIEATVQSWDFPVSIVEGEEAKLANYKKADVAIAASGTATLELAVYAIPMIAIYKLDPVAMPLRHLMYGWSASLPNLIADYPFVPERYNEFTDPKYLARLLEQLCTNPIARKQQLEGFGIVRERLKMDTPSAEKAAEIILSEAAKK